MKPLAAGVTSLEPQGIRTITELAWRTGGCIVLAVGEPNFQTPSHIVEAGVAAARGGWTKYTPNAGIASLRQAIAAKAARLNGLSVDPDQVVVTPGAVAAVASALITLAEPGDEVLMPDPSWPNGAMFLQMVGVRPVFYSLRLENGFLPDLAEWERLVTPRTKAVLINSPGNPTGAVFPVALVEQMVQFCRRHDLYLVSDEIYENITFGAPHVSAARFDADGRVITVSGFSKAYAMTGWRVGYALAAPPIAAQMVKIQEPLTSCVNAMAQKAAEAALGGPQNCVEEMRAAYHRRRDAALEILRRHDLYRYTPQGAMYLLVDIRQRGLPSMEFARRLVLEEKVAVAPGSAFGRWGEGYVRVSLASTEEEVREGMTRLCRFVTGVKVGGDA